MIKSSFQMLPVIGFQMNEYSLYVKWGSEYNMVMQMRGDKRYPGRGKWVKNPFYQKMSPGILWNIREGNNTNHSTISLV